MRKSSVRHILKSLILTTTEPMSYRTKKSMRLLRHIVILTAFLTLMVNNQVSLKTSKAFSSTRMEKDGIRSLLKCTINFIKDLSRLTNAQVSMKGKVWKRFGVTRSRENILPILDRLGRTCTSISKNTGGQSHPQEKIHLRKEMKVFRVPLQTIKMITLKTKRYTMQVTMTVITENRLIAV